MDEDRDEGRAVDDDDWLHPSPLLASMRRVEVASVTTAVALAVAGILTAKGSATAALVAFFAVIGAGALAAVLVHRRVQTWGYREREDDLLIKRGTLVSRLSVVPYGRMQFVDVTAGPIERMCGLVTVRLHTAAAASDARIPGLTRDNGTRLRDRLAALGEARASGL